MPTIIIKLRYAWRGGVSITSSPSWGDSSAVGPFSINTVSTTLKELWCGISCSVETWESGNQWKFYMMCKILIAFTNRVLPCVLSVGIDQGTVTPVAPVTEMPCKTGCQQRGTRSPRCKCFVCWCLFMRICAFTLCCRPHAVVFHGMPATQCTVANVFGIVYLPVCVLFANCIRLTAMVWLAGLLIMFLVIL